MGLKATLVVMLALGVPVRKDRNDEPPNVLEALQGRWQMVQANFGADPPPPDARVGETVLVIQGDKLIIQGGGGPKQEEAGFKTDLTRKPYGIDILPELGGVDPSGKQVVVRGIFEVKDDVLRLTFTRPGGERPTSFHPGGPFITLEFRRTAKK
jgi:uncharacterized protein (TIGR03067 family)